VNSLQFKNKRHSQHLRNAALQIKVGWKIKILHRHLHIVTTAKRSSVRKHSHETIFKLILLCRETKLLQKSTFAPLKLFSLFCSQGRPAAYFDLKLWIWWGQLDSRRVTDNNFALSHGHPSITGWRLCWLHQIHKFCLLRSRTQHLKFQLSFIHDVSISVSINNLRYWILATKRCWTAATI